MRPPLLYKSAIVLCCLALLPLLQARGQFIRISMEVEPELRTQTVQPLQFGELYQNSGPVRITMGESNMGIFSISGYPMQKVHVSLQPPDHLQHADRALSDSIAINLQAAYANRGVNRIEDAVLFQGNQVQFQMLQNATPLSAIELMRDVTAYIYIFGNLSVGNIAPGAYDGELVMQVEYL